VLRVRNQMQHLQSLSLEPFPGSPLHAELYNKSGSWEIILWK